MNIYDLHLLKHPEITETPVLWSLFLPTNKVEALDLSEENSATLALVNSYVPSGRQETFQLQFLPISSWMLWFA